MPLRRLLATLSLLAALTLPALASAQDQVKELTFEDDNVEGDLLAPGGGEFEGLIEDETTSLIKVREDFVDEMIKSAEGL
jgi:hypothetical protein